MYVNTKYRTKIEIRLENGIYFFNTESATGKTRLYDCLKQIQRWDKDVIAYSYCDVQDHKSLHDMFLDIPKAKVIMLDRYDMYIGYYSEDLVKLADRCVVLIDCKKPDFGLSDNDRVCGLEMTKNSIVVEE